MRERTSSEIRDSIAEASAGAEGMVHAAGSSSPLATPLALGWLHVAGTETRFEAHVTRAFVASC